MSAALQEKLREKLQGGLAALGLALSDAQQQQLLDYLDLIAKWNKVYNLTAIHGADQMLTHHLLDSMAIIPSLQARLFALRRSTPRVLDVGAGAGLPGVVVAICCPAVRVVCVDAVGKKAAFIRQAASALGLGNLQGLHSRVEGLPAAIDAEQGFDVITSRAFASLFDFTSLTRPLLSADGVWMAMKAQPAQDELSALPSGVRVFHVEHLAVPGLDEARCLVWLGGADV